MRAWHAMGPPQHGRVAGHPPASGGVTSHPADSTGTWQPPWPQSGGGKVQISPVRCAPSLPSPHGVGLQPTIPSAQGERAGCAQGRGLSSLELQVVLELHQPPAPPRLVPAPPPGTSREEAALQCSGTHLQGSNASCHTTHHSCVGPDFFQDLWETALQEATTWVRMGKKW